MSGMGHIEHDPDAVAIASVAVATAYPDDPRDGARFHALAMLDDDGVRLCVLLTDEQAATVLWGLKKSLGL